MIIGLIPMMLQQLGRSPKYEIISTKTVDDNDATVKYRIVSDKGVEEDDLKLVKRDGKWLVHIAAK